MALTAPTGRFPTSPHLEALLAEVARLAATIAQAPTAERRALADQRLMEAAIATLALDGAETDELPDLERARSIVAAAEPDAGPGTGLDAGPDAGPGAAPDAGPGTAAASPPREGTWLDAMGIAHEPTDELIRARELLGATAALSSDDLIGALTGTDSRAALAELHRRTVRGLVADERIGAPRNTDQAVHDASVGRVLYLPVTTDRIDAELDRVAGWLTDEAAAMPPMVASGVLHAELLHLHPYDAANGRVARAAARLLLRAGGLDPEGLAAPEPELADDPMGYHQAMADTIRRRDLRLWVERWAEAVAAGLRTSARALGLLRGTPPEHATRFATERDVPAFTLADYLDVVDGDREVAAADLQALLDAGRIERVLGSGGLRYTVRAPSGGQAGTAI